MRLVFDIETDGLLEETTKIHSLVIRNIETGEQWSCANPSAPLTDKSLESLDSGLARLASASELIGHNILGFDLKVLKKFNPSWKTSAKITDTLLCSRLIWTDVDEFDYPLVKKNILPARLIGSHSLEAWGYRIGVLKGDFPKSNDFKTWSPEMQRYCEQDVEVSTQFFKLIESKQYSQEAIQLEHDFAAIIYEMEDRGFCFNEAKARDLLETLVGRKEVLGCELQLAFPPKVVAWETPKKKQKRTKTVPFNPGSRVQIAERLMEKGWVPAKKTATGQAQVDEDVLEQLDIPEAKLLAEYLLVEKRIGQLYSGKQAWMGKIKNGRVHHRVNTNRAVTGRCGHHDFNIAQVPRVGSPYGAECRELFQASPGMVLVGADASGLELRCLGHYLAPLDGGAYALAASGPDVHSVNQVAFGLPDGKDGRNDSKTGIYCLIYGGADEKLGWSLKRLKDEHEAAAQARPIPPEALARMAKIGPITPDRIANWKRGNYARGKISTGITGYGELVESVATVVAGPRTGEVRNGFVVRDRSRARGWLRGLDGRRLRVRSEHAALNTLLQSAGALLVKKATVLWYRELISVGLVSGRDFALVAHIHDEIQAEAKPEHAELVGRTFLSAIREAGLGWNFRCPLSGEYKIGPDWKSTH